jgi:hypothetical protein
VPMLSSARRRRTGCGPVAASRRNRSPSNGSNSER